MEVRYGGGQVAQRRAHGKEEVCTRVRMRMRIRVRVCEETRVRIWVEEFPTLQARCGLLPTGEGRYVRFGVGPLVFASGNCTLFR